MSRPSLCPTDCSLKNFSIWDWKSKVRLNKFSNQNVMGSSISSVHFINEMALSVMLTASSESKPIVSCLRISSRGECSDLERV